MGQGHCMKAAAFVGWSATIAIAAMGALTGVTFAAGIATIQDVQNEGYRTPPGGSELVVPA